MLEVLNIVPPSPEQFDAVFHGMRHAFKSYDKADSKIIPKIGYTHENGVCEKVVTTSFALGENDKRLALNLTKAGNPSHRKFLRQLPIVMDIKAPEYWYKQLDAYKIGVVMNSTSQMHNLTSKTFEPEDFSWEDNGKYSSGTLILSNHKDLEDCFNHDLVLLFPNEARGVIMELLNAYRELYLKSDDQEEKDYLFGIINKILPQSYNYVRTVSLNYEVAMQIIEQRSSHKLIEWHQLIDELLELPYMKDFAGAAGLIEEE